MPHRSHSSFGFSCFGHESATEVIFIARVRASKQQKNLTCLPKQKKPPLPRQRIVMGLSCVVDDYSHKYNMCPWTGQAMQTFLSPDSAAALIPCSASPLPFRQPHSRPHQADDMSSDDSCSDGSRSASPSPNSRRRFPSLAFADAINIPFKSPISQPSTTSSSPNLSLSPMTPPSSFGSPAFASCAYPDWPQRANLSLNNSSYCGSQANSYISDDDLLDLEELELIGGMRVAPAVRAEISWEQTRQPPLVLHSLPAVARKAQPTPKKRRRSSPLKRKKIVLGMSPIAEAPE